VVSSLSLITSSSSCASSLLFRPMQNGIRIKPQGVRAWLRKRGLHWACFCVLEMDTSVSCQIIHALDGRVMAFCSQSPSRCGFRSTSVIFLRISLLTHFVSEFVQPISFSVVGVKLPTLNDPWYACSLFVHDRILIFVQDSGDTPDMGAILAAFILSGSSDPCPNFEGYCGEHQYEYPGLEQKSGPRKTPFGL
jgi:hypothetical protein